MDRQRLAALLDAYGAEPTRWPEAERAAALELLAASPDLARARDDASGFDRLLAMAPAGEVTNDLLVRILEAAPRPVAKPLPPRTGRRPFFALGDFIRLSQVGGGAIARPMAILLLAVSIGLGAGAIMPEAVDAAPADVDLLTAVWGSPAFNQDGADW